MVDVSNLIVLILYNIGYLSVMFYSTFFIYLSMGIWLLHEDYAIK